MLKHYVTHKIYLCLHANISIVWENDEILLWFVFLNNYNNEFLKKKNTNFPFLPGVFFFKHCCDFLKSLPIDKNQTSKCFLNHYCKKRLQNNDFSKISKITRTMKRLYQKCIYFIWIRFPISMRICTVYSVHSILMKKKRKNTQL